MQDLSKANARLIKWNGEAPSDPQAYVNPEQHPQCAEVVDLREGQPPVVTFKRNEDGTD